MYTSYDPKLDLWCICDAEGYPQEYFISEEEADAALKLINEATNG